MKSARLGRRHRLAWEAKEALRVHSECYLVVQVRKPSSRLRVGTKQRAALRALHLGDVGSKALLARKLELVRAVGHILPLVVITPVTRIPESAGVTVLEKPDTPLEAGPGTDDLQLAVDFGWESEAREVRSAMAPSPELVDTVKEAGRAIRPDLADAELDREATEIATELQADAVTRRSDLLRARADVRKMLNRKDA